MHVRILQTCQITLCSINKILYIIFNAYMTFTSQMIFHLQINCEDSEHHAKNKPTLIFKQSKHTKENCKKVNKCN